MATDRSDYDRLKDLKAFDDTKAGVKGLVDAGITKLPRIFIIPPEEVIRSTNTRVVNSAYQQIPTIDLQGVVDGDRGRRAEIVNEIRQAASTWGFFQVVNHGVGVDVLERLVEGVVRFFEQPKEAKMEYYTRYEKGKNVFYSSNFHLFQSKAADWRDTLSCVMTTNNPFHSLDLPQACRCVSLSCFCSLLETWILYLANIKTNWAKFQSSLCKKPVIGMLLTSLRILVFSSLAALCILSIPSASDGVSGRL
ncbi:hypothetical protein ACLOJK_015973 [Asimina triloba]